MMSLCLISECIGMFLIWCHMMGVGLGGGMGSSLGLGGCFVVLVVGGGILNCTWLLQGIGHCLLHDGRHVSNVMKRRAFLMAFEGFM